MDNDKKCFLCEQSLSTSASITSKEKGIMKLINSSKLRKDGKHVMLEACTKVPVHIMCSARYNRRSNIELNLKMNNIQKKNPNSLKQKKLQECIKKQLEATNQDEKFCDEVYQRCIKDEAIYDDVNRRHRYQIIEAAASIIRNDLAVMVYNHLNNPYCTTSLLDDPKNIPESLDILLKNIFRGSCCHPDKLTENYTSTAQSVLTTYLLNMDNSEV